MKKTQIVFTSNSQGNEIPAEAMARLMSSLIMLANNVEAKLQEKFAHCLLIWEAYVVELEENHPKVVNGDRFVMGATLSVCTKGSGPVFYATRQIFGQNGLQLVSYTKELQFFHDRVWYGHPISGYEQMTFDQLAGKAVEEIDWRIERDKEERSKK